MLFGPTLSGRDVVGDVLKVGIVLTLALSWPAWRVLVYDLVLKSPAEIAATIASPQLPDPSRHLSERLQNLDSGIVALTATGPGRNTGELLGADQAAGFKGIALNDETAFGWARLAFLAGTIAPLAVLRLGAGLLLALTPLLAGLLLFEATRGLFAGWARGLALIMLGSVGITLLLCAELAIVEPWLSDALRVRGLGYATPSAPMELLAMTSAFGLSSLGILLLLGRVAFHRGWRGSFSNAPSLPARIISTAHSAQPDASMRTAETPQSRAFVLAESVRSTVRREEHRGLAARQFAASGFAPARQGAAVGNPTLIARETALGSSWRRTNQRVSGAARRRDAAP